MAGPRRMSGRLRQDASPEHAPVDEGGGGAGGGRCPTRGEISVHTKSVILIIG